MTKLLRIFQAVQHLPVAEDFFQKEKDRRYSFSGPFSFFFNTLSDRLAIVALPQVTTPRLPSALQGGGFGRGLKNGISYTVKLDEYAQS